MRNRKKFSPLTILIKLVFVGDRLTSGHGGSGAVLALLCLLDDGTQTTTADGKHIFDERSLKRMINIILSSIT